MPELKIHIIIFLIFILCACGSYNPNNNIEVANYPEKNVKETTEVKAHIDKSLKIMYPNIGTYTLENELDGHKAVFFLGGSNFKVSFDSLGNWKKSKVVIQFTRSINSNVRKAIRNSEFSKWKLVKKELNEKPDEVEYEFNFQQGDNIVAVKYDDLGKLLKKEKSTIQIIK